MRWTVLLLALCACGSGKSKEQCRTEAAALKALFAEANLEPSVIWLDAKTHLAQRTDLPAQAPPYAPVISAGASEMRFRDKVITNLDALAAPLEETYRTAAEEIERFNLKRRPNPPDARNINLVFDESTPWRTVVDIVSTARRAGLTRPSFVFGLPTKATPPPRAPIDAELDKLVGEPDGNMATKFAEMISKEIKSCPAATKVFGAVGAEGGDDKAEFIASAIPDALVECNCNVDVPNLRAVLWRVMVNPNPTRVLTFDPDAPAEVIALPATTPWKDAATRFAPALKNAELVVE